MYNGPKIKASELIEEEVNKFQEEMGVILSERDLELLKKVISPSTKIIQGNLNKIGLS